MAWIAAVISFLISLNWNWRIFVFAHTPVNCYAHTQTAVVVVAEHRHHWPTKQLKNYCYLLNPNEKQTSAAARSPRVAEDEATKKGKWRKIAETKISKS